MCDKEWKISTILCVNALSFGEKFLEPFESGRHSCYIFIPLLFFGCIGCRIDCRSLSYCSLNHWLRGIRFAVKVSHLSISCIIYNRLDNLKSNPPAVLRDADGFCCFEFGEKTPIFWVLLLLLHFTVLRFQSQCHSFLLQPHFAYYTYFLYQLCKSRLWYIESVKWHDTAAMIMVRRM